MKRFNVAKGYFGAAAHRFVESGRHRQHRRRQSRHCGVRGEDGKVVWTATDDDASYSSGMAATIGGRRSAIFLTRDNLIGLDPATERSSSSGAGALASRR